MNQTKRAIIEATINIVAEKGLDGFSTRQIAKQLNISHTNIYAYFGSKEDLLIQCYHLVNREIANVFKDFEISEMDMSHLSEYLYIYWKKYFDFMIQNNKHSLFYYTFRESSYLPKILMRNSQEASSTMTDFMGEVAKIFSNGKEVQADIFWAYILDGTGVFVKHILKGNAICDESDVEFIWKLMSRGISGLLIH